MTESLIPKVCELLGVEIGEEFKIRDPFGEEYLCFIEKDGGVLLANSEIPRRPPGQMHLEYLLRGFWEIIKLPRKPKDGEHYWTFGLIMKGDRPFFTTSPDAWCGLPSEEALFKVGWVYRTKEEAEDALPAVAKELGVEYEL